MIKVPLIIQSILGLIGSIAIVFVFLSYVESDEDYLKELCSNVEINDD